MIKIDLRRMNRILEINEKSMYAVVEPYVIGAQLQAELMKRGLNCNQCGAGTNCSALPIAAHQGIGHLSQSASYGERNQLALEWVTPDGEIVRLGFSGVVGSVVLRRRAWSFIKRHRERECSSFGWPGGLY